MTAARIAPAEGRLGVLLPGLGAVSTTLIAGVELTRKGLAQPIGSLTQLGTIRLGKRTDNRTPLVREFVPLAGIGDLVLIAQGSSARQTQFTKDTPTDAVIMAIIDELAVDGKITFKK